MCVARVAAISATASDVRAMRLGLMVEVPVEGVQHPTPHAPVNMLSQSIPHAERVRARPTDLDAALVDHLQSKVRRCQVRKELGRLEAKRKGVGIEARKAG